MTAVAEKIAATYVNASFHLDDAKALYAALVQVSPAVYRKSYVPILANVKLEADINGNLTIAATDLELRIAKTIRGSGHEFYTTVNARTMRDTLKGASGPLTLTHDGTSLKIEGAVNITLPTLPAEEFPPEVARHNLEDIAWLDATTEAIRLAFTKCDCASDEAARGAILMGTLLEIKDGGANLVSTDGYKLAFVEIANASVRVRSEAPWRAIMPPSFAYVMRKLKRIKYASNIGALRIGTYNGTTFVEFTGDSLRVTVRCVDGQYPNYEQVVPKSADLVVTAPVAQMIATAKAASKVAGDRANMIKLAIDANAERITVTASSDDASFKSDVQIADPHTYGESALTIAFNGEYLAHCLGLFDLHEHIDARFMGPLSPAKFTDGHDYCVLMPLRQ